MKYVNFKELKIKNFLSVGEEVVKVNFETGLHIVTGINRDKEDRRNGVGKSTIADALYFSIFGNTLREIKKTFIPNNLTDGKTSVELSFSVDDPQYGINEFRIVRTLGPSKCTIYKNDVDKTRDTIQNTNQYIETVLSSSPEIFQNCVIMTLNNHIPFMAKNKVEKRKFIEKIFNLEVFSKMLNDVRSDQSEVKKDFDINVTRLEETSGYLQLQQNHKNNFDTDHNRKVSTLESTCDRHSADLKEANERLDTINRLDATPFQEKKDELGLKKKELREEMNTINHDLIECKLTLRSAAEDYKQIGTSEADCPVCLRPIADHDIEAIDEKKRDIKAGINDQKIKLDELTSKLNDIKTHEEKINTATQTLADKITAIEREKYSVKQVSDSINYIQKCITEIESELEGVKNETNTFDSVVSEYQDKVNIIETDINDLKNRLDFLDVAKFVVSEEGVKSFIVKKILRNFNSKLTHYLKKLDSNSICVFNEYFEEEIINEKGKVCLYNNFSGAERKAIDLACLFSFMDMRKAQGDVHYNISFYDELFDSSFDEKGVDLVLEILNDRVETQKECIFVISHRKESIKSATGDIVFLEKSNGITKRVEFVD